MAYSSNESGTDEVFVRPFPNAGGKWRISNGGGKYPMWSHNGRELFYVSETDDRIMVSNYVVRGNLFTASKPHFWADRQVLKPHFIRVLDLHPDKESCLCSQSSDPTPPLFRSHEFSALTGLSLRTVANLIGDATLHVKRGGRRTLIPRAELLRFAKYRRLSGG